MVVVALLSVYLVESVYVVSVYLVVNCILKIYLRLFLVFLNAYVVRTCLEKPFFYSVVDGENKSHHKNVGVHLKSGAIMR